ncbi:MAG: hypothetical protein B7Y10_03845 [Sphingomonadales bacterium 24-56-14]|nr:MAG: hypothetical protein B7Y10_03845 [Sphingomonadales bacterium 24-56-14]
MLATGVLTTRKKECRCVKTTESGAVLGYNAGKKVMAGKRHIITGTNGFLAHAIFHSADIPDRDGAPMVLRDTRHSFTWLRHVFADGGYAGDKLKTPRTEIGDWTIEVIRRYDSVKGFVVLPRRWVVERTSAWLLMISYNMIIVQALRTARNPHTRNPHKALNRKIGETMSSKIFVVVLP